MTRSVLRHTRSWLLPAIVVALSAPGVRTALAQSNDREPTVITGVVYDSIAGVPLAGATVELAPTAESLTDRVFTATSDRSGRFTLRNVPPGEYIAGFRHPVLDTLGVEVPRRRVAIRSGEQRIDLGTPSPGTIARILCGPRANERRAGLLLGHVRGAADDIPIAGATVLVEWMEAVIDSGSVGYRELRAEARTGSSGRFVICDLPAGAALLARASHAGDSTGYVDMEIAPGVVRHLTFHVGGGTRRAVTRVDTTLTDSSSRDSIVTWSGTARLTGVVRDDRRRPVANASVGVEGTRRETVGDERGRFSLDSLPAGTQTVEARLIGFQPTRVVVRLIPDRTATVDIILGKRVPVLESEFVYARGAGEFERRRRLSVSGSFITRETIERRGSNATLAQLLQEAPGVQVDNRPGGPSVTMRRTTPTSPGATRCTPSLYVNGVRDLSANFAFLYSDEIAGIEIYPREISRPVEFTDRNRCGAIAVWTREIPAEQWKKYGAKWRFAAAIGFAIVLIAGMLRVTEPLD